MATDEAWAQAMFLWPVIDPRLHRINTDRAMKRSAFIDGAVWQADHPITDQQIERLAEWLCENVYSDSADEGDDEYEWAKVSDSQRKVWRKLARDAFAFMLTGVQPS